MKVGTALIFALSLATACGNIHTPLTDDTKKPIVDVPINPLPDPGQNPDPDPDPTPDPGVPLQPRPENPTRYCSRNRRGEFDTTLELQGGGSKKPYYWAEGGGCVLKPIDQAWKLSQDQDRTAWADVDGHVIVDFKVIDNEKIWTTNYWVNSIIGKVEWNIDWHHSIMAGTEADPQTVLINYKKVWGTIHIQYWEGSIVLERVTDNVTSFTMRNQIRADRTHQAEAEGAVRDFFHRVF
jgi:hypothetical protein